MHAVTLHLCSPFPACKVLLNFSPSSCCLFFFFFIISYVYLHFPLVFAFKAARKLCVVSKPTPQVCFSQALVKCARLPLSQSRGTRSEWRGLLKMLLTSSRISYTGFFFFNPETEVFTEWKGGALSFAPTCSNVDFLSVLLSSVFELFFQEPWLKIVRHNLYCSSAFFHFHLGTISEVGLRTGRIWGFLWEFFALQGLKAPEILVWFTFKENPSLLHREVPEQLTSAAAIHVFRILIDTLTNRSIFVYPRFYWN